MSPDMSRKPPLTSPDRGGKARGVSENRSGVSMYGNMNVGDKVKEQEGGYKNVLENVGGLNPDRRPMTVEEMLRMKRNDPSKRK